MSLTWERVHAAVADGYAPSRFHRREHIRLADIAALVNLGDIPGLTARLRHMPDTRLFDPTFGPQPKRTPRLGLSLHAFGSDQPIREFNPTVGALNAVQEALRFVSERHARLSRRPAGGVEQPSMTVAGIASAV